MLIMACFRRLASVDPNPTAIGQDTWNYLAAGERLKTLRDRWRRSHG